MTLKSIFEYEDDPKPLPLIEQSVAQIAALSKRLRHLGSATSGNFGHAGRPGQIGGSAPSGILDAIAKADGGFTYHTVTHEQPKTGYALSLHPDREKILPAKDVTVVELAKYTAKNRDLLAQANNYLGGWHNPADGKAYLDVSTIVKTPEEAERLGALAHQYAYFDLEKGQSVKIKSDRYYVPKAATSYALRHRTLCWGTYPRRSHRTRQVADRSGTDAAGDSAGEGDPRTLTDPLRRSLGGPGSGFFDHKGRPGEVGGSASAGTTLEPKTDAGKSLRDRLQLSGYKTLTVAQVPEETRERLGLKPAGKPLSSGALEGIDLALKDIAAISPVVDQTIREQVPIVYGDYEDEGVSATFAGGPEGAFILINGLAGEQKLTSEARAFTVAARRATEMGLSGEAYNREVYRGIVLHEIGHLANRMVGDRLSDVATNTLVHALPKPWEETVPKFLQKHVSEYAAWAGPQEATAEIFAATVLGHSMPSELHDYQTQLKQLLKAGRGVD